MPEQIIHRKAHPLYRTWKSMRNRCSNPNSPDYPDYGGRGISVWPAWDDFWVFVADVGERPEGRSIDRYPDKDGDYRPGNVRWATAKEQANNRRQRTDAQLITYNGKTAHVREWAKTLGVNPITLKGRLRAWGVQRAFSTPPIARK